MWISLHDHQREALDSALSYRINDLLKAIDVLKDADQSEAVQRVNEKKAELEEILKKLRDWQTEPATYAAYRSAAESQNHEDGVLEIDEGAVVSPGEDAGAYVMAWVWVSDAEAGISGENDGE